MFRTMLQALFCGLTLTNIAIADRDIVLLSGNAEKVVIYDEDGLI